MYFLFADEGELLLDLVGRPMAVPRIVYDPSEDPDTPKDARSEITRSVDYQLSVATDRARDESQRGQARANAERLAGIHQFHQAGHVTTIDLDPEELRLVSSLTSPSGCRGFNLRHPLQAGEAACLAVAVTRHLRLATDDGDAIKALATIRGAPEYRRIRGLLVAAADDGRIPRERANAIHREMRRLGFWDRDVPFPE